MNPAEELNHVYYQLAVAQGYPVKDGEVTADPNKVLEDALEAIHRLNDLEK